MCFYFIFYVIVAGSLPQCRIHEWIQQSRELQTKLQQRPPSCWQEQVPANYDRDRSFLVLNNFCYQIETLIIVTACLLFKLQASSL